MGSVLERIWLRRLGHLALDALRPRQQQSTALTWSGLIWSICGAYSCRGAVEQAVSAVNRQTKHQPRKQSSKNSQAHQDDDHTDRSVFNERFAAAGHITPARDQSHGGNLRTSLVLEDKVFSGKWWWSTVWHWFSPARVGCAHSSQPKCQARGNQDELAR